MSSACPPENVTITANSFRTNGKQKSQEYVRIASRDYLPSDSSLSLGTSVYSPFRPTSPSSPTACRTSRREFSVSSHPVRQTLTRSQLWRAEIQELRHKSQSGDASSASTVIDQSLAQLDECLEAVAQGVKAVNESMEPLLQSHKSNLRPIDGDDEEAVTIRKHATMLSEWEAVQKESQVLREELKEDKWLTVFRTVTDQADGMMSSLEKAINRCQVRFTSRLGQRCPESVPRISYTRFIDAVQTTLLPSLNHLP